MEDDITECPLDSSSDEDDYAIPSHADARGEDEVSKLASGGASSSVTLTANRLKDPSVTGARPKTTRSHSVQISGLPWSRFKDQSHGARAPNPGHHRPVRPFFCCGSELSLISMMDNVDLNTTVRLSAASNVARFAALEEKVGAVRELERLTNHCLSHSRSCTMELGAACGSGTSVQTVCGVGRAGGGSLVRRVKSDKSKNKKGFWSLRFHHKLPGSLKFSQIRRSACAECGSKKCNASRVPPCDFICEKGKACPCRKLSYQCAAAELAKRQGMMSDRRSSFNGIFPINGNEELLARERSLECAAGHARRHGEKVLQFNSSADEVSFSGLASPLQTDSAVSGLVLVRDTLQTDFVHSSLVNALIHDSFVHTRIDYIHHLVPDLQKITTCSFYWGVIDRYEAERLLDKKREGTFLLRDSAQDDFLFSVSFRRYNRSLHARIEQWNHLFSFDVHDPAVYSADSVCGLIEHYKDSSRCLFFEPMLTAPLHRTFPFTLQHLARAVVCNNLQRYDSITKLPLPLSMKTYLRYYHYKQKVCVRSFEESAG